MRGPTAFLISEAALDIIQTLKAVLSVSETLHSTGSMTLDEYRAVLRWVTDMLIVADNARTRVEEELIETEAEIAALRQPLQ